MSESPAYRRAPVPKPRKHFAIVYFWADWRDSCDPIVAIHGLNVEVIVHGWTLKDVVWEVVFVDRRESAPMAAPPTPIFTVLLKARGVREW